MKKNQSLPYANGPGVQPIRALHSLILGLFENASQDFINTLSEQIEFFGANPKIVYDIVPASVEGPYIQGIEGAMHIQESFLSYLWAITYSQVLLVDEEVTRPQIEENYSRSAVQTKLIEDAYNLLIYALKLRKSYAVWDMEQLPNPELFATDESYYIEKSSAVFTQAIVFILIHEFAHFYLGHLESGPSANNAESIDDETKADNYAISIMKEGVDFLVNKETIYCGITVGMIAILFLHTSLDGQTHPDPHKRLYSALGQMELEPNNMLWALASTGIALWAHYHHKPRVGGHDYDSLQENFEKLMQELDDPSFFTT